MVVAENAANDTDTIADAPVAGPDGPAIPAPDTDNEGGAEARVAAVGAALIATPGGSATAIGAAAGMSRVAVGKILNQLEIDGRARRVAGGHDGQGRGRTPDRWYPTDNDDMTDSSTVALEQTVKVDLPDPAEVTPTAATTDDLNVADLYETTEDATGLDTHQEAVLAALEGNSGWSAAAIGVAAGLTREGAIKVLDQLVAAGLASRGDDEDRSKDEWYLASGDEPTARDEAPEVNVEPTQTFPPDADETPDEPTAEPVADTDPAWARVRAELLELADLLSGTVTAKDDNGDAVMALGRLEMAMAKAAQVHRTARAVLTGITPAPARTPSTRTGNGGGGGVTVRPGALRDRVHAHLTEHPGKEFTPYEIGRVLDASSGAVANALDRLVSLGQAALTCERPRRFALAATDSTSD
ncbi:MarR family transcriptional regulator [Nonomuraea sp. NPDC049400]|uniref:MarR family transcriptional regulator n=1 Tax=Nonomuraea sp. NPDC049400 TaxID=3364352 RepID=UPI0037892D05